LIGSKLTSTKFFPLADANKICGTEMYKIGAKKYLFRNWRTQRGMGVLSWGGGSAMKINKFE